jgi:hypothetical protein
MRVVIRRTHTATFNVAESVLAYKDECSVVEAKRISLVPLFVLQSICLLLCLAACAVRGIGRSRKTNKSRTHLQAEEVRIEDPDGMQIVIVVFLRNSCCTGDAKGDAGDDDKAAGSPGQDTGLNDSEYCFVFQWNSLDEEASTGASKEVSKAVPCEFCVSIADSPWLQDFFNWLQREAGKSQATAYRYKLTALSCVLLHGVKNVNDPTYLARIKETASGMQFLAAQLGSGFTAIECWQRFCSDKRFHECRCLQIDTLSWIAGESLVAKPQNKRNDSFRIWMKSARYEKGGSSNPYSKKKQQQHVSKVAAIVEWRVPGLTEQDLRLPDLRACLQKRGFTKSQIQTISAAAQCYRRFLNLGFSTDADGGTGFGDGEDGVGKKRQCTVLLAPVLIID